MTKRQGNKLIIIRVLFFLFVVFVHMQPVNAYVEGLPTAHSPCPDGSINVYEANFFRCISSVHAESSGLFFLGAGSEWRTGDGQGDGFAWVYAYVPYAGMWSVKAHLCNTSKSEKCTIAKSSVVIPAAKVVKLNTLSSINAQNPDFGGNAISIPRVNNGVTLCYSLVDSRGVEWSPRMGMSCSDGAILPDHPSFCYINDNNPILEINMGTLERTGIAKIPGTSPAVNRSISILCSGSAEISARFKFQYTAMPIDGTQVIQAKYVNDDSLDLGIAVSLDDKLMPPETLSKEYHFSPGANDVTLKFETVRNDKVEPNNIPTGAFYANAILVLIQQ